MKPKQMVIEFLSAMAIEDRQFKVSYAEFWIAGRYNEWISTSTIQDTFKEHCDKVMYPKGPRGNWVVSEEFKKKNFIH